MPAAVTAQPVRDVDGTHRCPRCATALVAYADHMPWCPRCQWNLDAYRPVFEREGIVGKLNRRAHAIGFRQGPQIVRELAGHEVLRPRPTVGSRILVATSILLYLVIAGLLVAGLWLVTRMQPVAMVAGLPILLLGWALRPRFGSRRRQLKLTWKLDRDKTPELYALLDRVAAAVGGHTPKTVTFGLTWNASIGRFGPLRREVLELGLPLFVSARPQERIALLAHELGHQVNRDARQGILTQPALTVFAKLSRLTFLPIPQAVPTHPVYLAVALALRLVSWAMLAAHLGLNLLGSKESRRAEHYADALAARVGGTLAAQGVMDLLVLGQDMDKLIRQVARRSTSTGWRATIDSARERWSAEMDVRRQLTLRTEASALGSHPATALRHELLGATPFHDPAIVLTEAQAQRLERELAGYALAYDRFLRQLAGPRAD